MPLALSATLFLLVAFLVASALLVIALAASPAYAKESKASSAEQSVTLLTDDNSKKGSSTKQSVTLVAVGDNLIHTKVYQAAHRKSGGYDFSGIFKHVKKDIQDADIAVINQETILVDSYPTGYPSFGTPKRAMTRAIVGAGFDVVQHATNHTMDRGPSAIRGTLSYWRKAYPKIKVLGIHSSSKDARKITVIERNGIKIAMLNYTYGLNGAEGRLRGQRYLVDMFNKSKAKSDVKRAKKMADFVIVFAHMGTEYRHAPDAYAKSWTKYFANLGVDLMIGTHPHVLEPVRWVEGTGSHRMLAYYSLGNFVSSQARLDTMLGGMAKVTITKTTPKADSDVVASPSDASTFNTSLSGTSLSYVSPSGSATSAASPSGAAQDSKSLNTQGKIKKGKLLPKTRITSNKLVPLVTHIPRNSSYFTVYKLADYTPKLARSHRIGSVSVGALRSTFHKITGRKVVR